MVWRPKSLQGIENNNGWITIKKKSELPEGNCWVRVYCESNIPDKPIDYISEKYKVNPVQYQPIIKPEAPIY